jgi:hypothetical protein
MSPLTTTKIGTATGFATIRRLFSDLFSFVDQSHDYSARSLRAWDDIVALLAEAFLAVLAPEVLV